MSSSSKRKTVQLLVVDDDPAVLALIAAALEKEDLEIHAEQDPQTGLALALELRPDIVLVDMRMPGLSGMELLSKLVEARPLTDVILMTAHYSTESAVEAIQKGACDYLEKPLSIEKLRQRIGKLAEDARRRRRFSEIEAELLDAAQFHGMIGQSGPMLELFAQVRRIAAHFRTVLVTGPTGTGKELLARALHELSPAASGPFAVCNCSAVVETLFESELFGHVKGAFTGATQDKVGLFEYANHGTVFLDEIGDMPLATQAKILRVLQSQEVQRVGSPAPRKLDVRVIAATHRDLPALVKEGTFREDLFFRLTTVQLGVPRLAERMDDVPLLTRHFLNHYATEYRKPIRGLTPRAASTLARYSWPGNVRELENAIAHACMMAQGEMIDVRDLPPATLIRSAFPGDGQAGDLLPLDTIIDQHFERVLAHVKGKRVRAAEILGIGRTTLYRMIRKKEKEKEKKESTA